MVEWTAIVRQDHNLHLVIKTMAGVLLKDCLSLSSTQILVSVFMETRNFSTMDQVNVIKKPTTNVRSAKL